MIQRHQKVSNIDLQGVPKDPYNQQGFMKLDVLMLVELMRCYVLLPSFIGIVTKRMTDIFLSRVFSSF